MYTVLGRVLLKLHAWYYSNKLQRSLIEEEKNSITTTHIIRREKNKRKSNFISRDKKPSPKKSDTE